MELELTEGVQSGWQVRDHLQNVAATLEAASHKGSSERYGAYFDWATRSAFDLRLTLTAASIDELILTPRFYALLGTRTAVLNDAVLTLLSLEFETASAALKTALSTLEKELREWCSTRLHLITADTNVFLHCLGPDELSAKTLIGSNEQAHLIVPIAVIDELEKLKRGNTRHAAARALRKLYEWTDGGTRIGTIPTSDPDIEELAVQIVLDGPSHQKVSDTDDEIISRVLRVGRIAGKRAYLVSNDTGMLARAARAGLIAKYIKQRDDHE